MLFFPLPYTYAVVEIDVDKTLEPLNDPAAKAAGAGIKTVKCIIYLDTILRLPFPDDSTFKYMAYLVGPGLRPEIPALCLTPDMCTPIFPNTHHPFDDREPLRPDPPFPFGNCYHWFGPDMWLDLRIYNDGRDYRVGPRTVLPPIQHVEMGIVQGQDMWRCACAQQEEYVASGAVADDTQPVAEPTLPEESGESKARPQARNTSPTPSSAPSVAAPFEHDAASLRSETGSTSNSVGSEYHLGERCERCGAYGDCYTEHGSDDGGFYQAPEANESTEALAEIDVFGRDDDEGDDLLPIVKISLDIGAHFPSETDVPNPMVFMQQRDELVRIIEESKARGEEACEAAQSEVVAEESPEPGDLALALESVALGDATTSVVDPPALDEAEGAYGKQPAKGFWSKLANTSTSLHRGA